MSESKFVYLFGYSGHAYVIIESLLDAGYSIKGYFELSQVEKNPYNLEYFGNEKEVPVQKIVGEDLVFPAIGDTQIRKEMIHFFESLGLHQFAAVDPTANVSKTASIGHSSYVGKNVILNAQAAIGKGVILNSGSVVEHDCRVGDFAHMAPAAVLCGNVSVGAQSFVGANAVVRQNLEIGAEISVGAGSVVTKDLQDKGTWIGNKLRKL